MSEDFLARMAAGSQARVAEARRRCSEASLLSQARARPAAPPLRLSGGFDLIAELKLRSPAVGILQTGIGTDELTARINGYAEAGAAAVSVLTEPSRFDGELAHLTDAARSLAGRVPAMRKDFLVDPYQVCEARVAGASGVLLILRMLPRSSQETLIAACSELGLFALLEAFDEADLALAAELISAHAGRAQLLVGINCRDLTTLQVVPGRLEALAAYLPHGVPRVAESGVEQPADAARLAQAGYTMALVGSALMRAADPIALIRELLAAGRGAVQATGASRSREEHRTCG